MIDTAETVVQFLNVFSGNEPRKLGRVEPVLIRPLLVLLLLDSKTNREHISLGLDGLGFPFVQYSLTGQP